ncbi:putative F-box protein PP2-B12 [Triticum dicoccoides]|uniref:putative F-box protein PP2-B12 n=1 Tax=Triticum dicoccoides TaxID=85692 RepID=UPI0018905AB4|nr:putative F-box protein PP2-B12 [Triticum dicoccoides]
MEKKQERKGNDSGSGSIQQIPEECLAKAIGLTSPADACRAGAVSAAFRSAADSDAAWEGFLPPDCDAILERAVHLVDFSSKKELFHDLSDEHVLLDDGKRSFGLHRSSGAKCYMLSANVLEIAWVGVDLYWTKRSDPDSRFSKVAELVAVCLFHIHGIISTKELSPGTHYAAYLVFKLTHHASGLNSPCQRSRVDIGEQLVRSAHRVSLHPCNRACSAGNDQMSMMNGGTKLHEHEDEEGGGAIRYPCPRTDGWLELEMGDFHTSTSVDDADVYMELRESEEPQWKKGLIIEGIEIRPKN